MVYTRPTVGERLESVSWVSTVAMLPKSIIKTLLPTFDSMQDTGQHVDVVPGRGLAQ